MEFEKAVTNLKPFNAFDSLFHGKKQRGF